MSKCATREARASRFYSRKEIHLAKSNKTAQNAATTAAEPTLPQPEVPPATVPETVPPVQPEVPPTVPTPPPANPPEKPLGEKVSIYHLVVNVKSRLGLDEKPDLETLRGDLDEAEARLTDTFPDIKDRMPAEGLNLQELFEHATQHRNNGNQEPQLASCLIGMIARLRADIATRQPTEKAS